jgi:hypothetical protein
MKTRFIIAVLIAVVTFGFAYAHDAHAITITANWAHTSGNCFDATFSFYVATTPNLPGVYTLDGKMTISDIVWPIRGAAVLDSSSDTFRVSLFSTSATGETFTFGMQVDPATMAGTGNYQRIAHGDVNSDCPGTVSNVTILP